jgi:hypothetical protein
VCEVDGLIMLQDRIAVIAAKSRVNKQAIL